eukprot:12093624-Alexandrium_andersonii.AAC.1
MGPVPAAWWQASRARVGSVPALAGVAAAGGAFRSAALARRAFAHRRARRALEWLRLRPPPL